MGPRDIVLAFDAYGTLLSTQSIATKLASHFGEEKANAIAVTWRRHQLEYTWRLNSMGIYFDFVFTTRRSLRNALAECEVELNEDQIKEMVTAYDSLSTFDDVQPTMEKLKDLQGVKPVVFSNGTHDMVSSSVRNSPDLSPHASVFHKIISVETVRKYKPAPETYNHLAKVMGKNVLDGGQMSEIWLVSGNPFDVVGARAVGMNAIWIDRAGKGWQDHLLPAESNRPTKIVKSMIEVVDIAKEAVGA